MKSHAENNPVLRISMPQTGGGFIKVCWRKTQALVQDVFRPTNIEIIVLLKLSKEPPYASQGSVDSFDNDVAAETPNDSGMLTSLALAQPSDPSVKNNFQWVTSSTPLSTHDLQGLPRATWHMVNEFHSRKIINDIPCREFVNKRRPPHHQQIPTASLVPQNLVSIQSASTGGHLGLIKTVEKVRERFYWPGFQEGKKLFINRLSMNNVRKELT